VYATLSARALGQCEGGPRAAYWRAARRQAADLHWRRQRVAAQARGIDPRDAGLRREPEPPVGALDSGAEWPNVHGSPLESVPNAKPIGACSVSRVALRVSELGRGHTRDALVAVEPQVAVSRLNDSGDAVKRPVCDGEWHEARAVAHIVEVHDTCLATDPHTGAACVDRGHRADAEAVRRREDACPFGGDESKSVALVPQPSSPSMVGVDGSRIRITAEVLPRNIVLPHMRPAPEHAAEQHREPQRAVAVSRDGLDEGSGSLWRQRHRGERPGVRAWSLVPQPVESADPHATLEIARHRRDPS
jgi:hypothetical protein